MYRFVQVRYTQEIYAKGKSSHPVEVYFTKNTHIQVFVLPLNTTKRQAFNLIYTGSPPLLGQNNCLGSLPSFIRKWYHLIKQKLQAQALDH
jgi:hypothetical protein